MSEQIRPAVDADVEAIVAMASERRREYERYQPLFWRPSSYAERAHRPFLRRLVADEDAVTLVSEQDGEMTGFVVATIGKAPPVYDPGGPSCLIDDFAVAPGRWASTGAALLRAAVGEVGRRGAVQVVVVTGHLDKPKREALRACGLSLASEWWTAATPAAPEP